MRRTFIFRKIGMKSNYVLELMREFKKETAPTKLEASILLRNRRKLRVEQVKPIVEKVVSANLLASEAIEDRELAKFNELVKSSKMGIRRIKEKRRANLRSLKKQLAALQAEYAALTSK